MSTFIDPNVAVAQTARERRGMTRREIWLPLFGGIGGLLALTGLVALMGGDRTGVVSNFLLTAFVLCPAALCLFPLYILMVVAAFGMGRATQGVTKPLQSIERMTVQMTQGAHRISQVASKHAINANVRFTQIEKRVNFFDHPRQKQLPKPIVEPKNPEMEKGE